VECNEFAQRQVDQHIGVDKDKGAVLEKRLGFKKTPARVQQVRLSGIGDLQAQLRAIAETAFNLLT
jgi:hypothetical protein